MKLISYLFAATLCIACQQKQDTAAVDQTPTLDETFLAIATAACQEKEEPSRFYVVDTTYYYIDKKGVNKERFEEACSYDQLGYITDLALRKGEQILKSPDDKIHIDHKTYGFTAAYLIQHFFQPAHVDLYVNEYKNLFFSIGTDQIDTMKIDLFDKRTGAKISGRGDWDYNGRYSVGIYQEDPLSIRDARLVLMVGDSIYYQDYDSSYIMRMYEERKTME